MNSHFMRNFSAEDLDRVFNAPSTHKRHPLGRMVRCLREGESGSKGQEGNTLANLNRAIGLIHGAGSQDLSDWLQYASAQAIKIEGDYANASSALSEIRALGALLEMGLPVTVVRTRREMKTADFYIEPFNCYVEVHCKQMYGPAANEVVAFHAEPMPPPGPDGFSARYHEVRPVGGTDEETNVENLAQKIAQIKPRSEQAVDGAQNVLWLDFQDEDFWCLGSRYLHPISSCHQRFYSGGLWLAFYGRKGTALLEHHHLHHEENADPALQQMRFDGRFYQEGDRFDAAILYFPDETAFLQNPNRADLAATWMPHLMRSLRFSFEGSWCDWPPQRPLAEQIQEQLDRMDSIGEWVHGASVPDTLRLSGIEVPEDFRKG